MTAEALRRRMAHGNIYAPEKVDAALANYFRAGNLTALRELALLWTADQVDEALQRYRAQHDIAGTWEARERVVVALTGGPEGETLHPARRPHRRRAAGGDLLAVHVARSDGLTGASRRARRAAAARRVPRRQLPPGRRRRRGRRPARPSPAPRTRPSSCSAPAAVAAGRCSTGPGIGASTIRESGDIDVHIVTHAADRAGLSLPATARQPGAGDGGSRASCSRVVLPPLLTLAAAPFRGRR